MVVVCSEDFRETAAHLTFIRMKKLNAMCVKAAEFPEFVVTYFSKKSQKYKNFLTTEVAFDQLEILKEICKSHTGETDSVKFLATVFLLSPVKHPIKKFTKRYILKKYGSHEEMEKILSAEIEIIMRAIPVENSDYFLSRAISPCFENFPPGIKAIRKIDLKLFTYINNSLMWTMTSLEDLRMFPTTRNERNSQMHITLQMILQMLQQAQYDRIPVLKEQFTKLHNGIKKVFSNEEVPMDSKTLGGIILLLMHLLDKGRSRWIDVLLAGQESNLFSNYLTSDAEELALYSAVVTLAPESELESSVVNEHPAILDLTSRVLDIGNRTSSDSTYTLLVSRTVLQISKFLNKIENLQVGDQLVAKILDFVWSHLEHFMNSVRHLATQSLTLVVEYCANLPDDVRQSSICKLMKNLNYLDRGSKSFYVFVAALVQDCGATAILDHTPGLAATLLHALEQQELQSSAHHCINTLLAKHLLESDSLTFDSYWVTKILDHIEQDNVDSTVLDMLKNILKGAIKLNGQIKNNLIIQVVEVGAMDHESQPCGTALKRALFLLSVIKCCDNCDSPEMVELFGWKDLISYPMLKTAAVLANEETRVLALSIIVCSLRSTEPYTKADLDFVIHFLTYNMDPQLPSFRQSLISHANKFLCRFVDSYKAARRNKVMDTVAEYERFLGQLVQLCYDSIRPGLNQRRREFALNLLLSIYKLTVDIIKPWKPEYVEALFLQLGDTFEVIIDAAYTALGYCPSHFFKKEGGTINMDLSALLQQASSCKLSESVSAAFKLLVIRAKRPDEVRASTRLIHVQPSEKAPVDYILISILINHLRSQHRVAQQSLARAAAEAPMYGVIRCCGELLKRIDEGEISRDLAWTKLIADLIVLVLEVISVLEEVVYSDSPEGQLSSDEHVDTIFEEELGPDDDALMLVVGFGPNSKIKGDEANGVSNSDINEDKSQDIDQDFSAQKLLLCAWRSVKESSFLLSEMVSRLSICGEGFDQGNLTQQQVKDIGEYFLKVLLKTKHRGAFEQAHVGFIRLVKRLLKCSNPSLHELPRDWLMDLLVVIRARDNPLLSSTRRSAGIPFMIQALVSSEILVNLTTNMFNSTMTNLLFLAKVQACSPTDETRIHALNILRALYKHTTLGEAAASRVVEGLMVAIDAFDSKSWSERNSATLLFSALIVRVFGVQRARGLAAVSQRNCLTGRLFFQRYPSLYDFMLKRLREFREGRRGSLLPSLYPILLLLSRLYPSTSEKSNEQLNQFIPYVQECLRSSVCKTRELAAKAMVPLYTPEQIGAYVLEMLSLLLQGEISTNYRHGILLVLTHSLETATFPRTQELTKCLAEHVARSTWLMGTARSDQPCYMLLAEYAALINQLLQRFPDVIPVDVYTYIFDSLKQIIHENENKPGIGRDYALGNCNLLLFVLLCKYEPSELHNFIIKSLSSRYDEVVVTTLKYLLIIQGSTQYAENNSFLKHLNETTDKDTTLSRIQADSYTYIYSLQTVVKISGNVKGRQRATKLLSLEPNTEEIIVTSRLGRAPIDETDLVNQMIVFVAADDEQARFIYLLSLLKYTGQKMQSLDKGLLLKALRAMFVSAAADDACAGLVLKFIAENADAMLQLNFERNSQRKERFHFMVTLLSTVALLLESEDTSIRQRAANAVALLLPGAANDRLLPSKAAEKLLELLETLARDKEEAIAMYTALALLDFQPEERDKPHEQLKDKAFDPRPPATEEILWTINCCEKIKVILASTSDGDNDNDNDDPDSDDDAVEPTHRERCRNLFYKIFHSQYYDTCLAQMCQPSFISFKEFLQLNVMDVVKLEIANYKLKVFINSLFFANK